MCLWADNSDATRLSVWREAHTSVKGALISMHTACSLSHWARRTMGFSQPGSVERKRKRKALMQGQHIVCFFSLSFVDEAEARAARCKVNYVCRFNSRNAPKNGLFTRSCANTETFTACVHSKYISIPQCIITVGLDVITSASLKWIWILACVVKDG